MTEDLLVQRKQEQRRKFLRALYGLSNGKEGLTIAPMNYIAIGSQVGVGKEEALEAINFFVSEGLLVFKPASEAVALTHKGVVIVEQNAATIAAERSKRLERLPDKITAVLESAPDTLNLIQLRAALQEYRDFDDADFFEALRVLDARGIVSAETTASSVGQPVNAAYHYGVANRGRIKEIEALDLEPMKTREGTPVTADSRKVFVVHGHDEAMENQVARFLERLDLTPVILHEQASQGRTIIEKFERHSSDVGFAVVLLSSDDVGSVKGGTLSPRARQNVILELGYFIGRLGREKVCALHTGGVELPSDLHDVIWVAYSGDWKLKLAQELKAAGIPVDMNRL